jgi:excisionase family DNA binding protein
MKPFHIPDGDYFTVADVATTLGVTRRTIINWLESDLLTGIKLGSNTANWLIEASQLEDFEPPKVGRPPKK